MCLQASTFLWIQAWVEWGSEEIPPHDRRLCLHLDIDTLVTKFLPIPVREDVFLGQHFPQLRRRRPAHRFLVDVRERGLTQGRVREDGEVEAQLFGGEQPDRAVERAFAVEADAAAAGFGGDAVVFEKARHPFGVVGVEVQMHRRVGVGGALERGADEAGVEVAEEIERAQGGVATAAQFRGLGIALEQALVFAQGFLDLAVARQRSVVVDAQARGGLEFGLMEVADAGFGDQPGGFVGEAIAALAGPGLGVLAGVVHGQRPGGARG